ncbi:MAG: co-chaperone GroES [Thiotrichales bacterium]|nr:MAG: co-chaperone GroES [Thiotrichales bacterium]
MKIRPLHDRIVVQLVEDSNTTSGGIIIPDNHSKKPSKAKVIKVGPGKIDKNGKRIPMDVKEGDVVAFEEYAGTTLNIGGDEFLVIREDNVIAVLQS